MKILSIWKSQKNRRHSGRPFELKTSTGF